MVASKIDIKENRLVDLNNTLLDILLKDNTTKKNLIWATDTYEKKGYAYSFDSYMQADLITGYHGNVIKPRVEKSKNEKLARVRNKAEVFTPSWVCNLQNNLIDNEWIGFANAFNFEKEEGWITNYKTIKFPRDSKKNWKEYVKSVRLEMACGEAPYITSRYDTVTGDYIEVKERIGFLDRKLRVVGENVDDEKLWVEWATRAVKATYGYDYQGDNVLLARENILYTVMEHYANKFDKELETEVIVKIAKIISWNIWQMDGMKYVVPNSCIAMDYVQLSFFETDVAEQKCIGCVKNNPYEHTGKYCIVMDWKEQKTVRFIDLMER